MLNKWYFFVFFLFIFASSGYAGTVPGSVKSFKIVGSSKVTEGKTIFLRWKKPSKSSATVKYNFYLTKPGQKLTKYKSSYSGTLISLKVSGAGVHKFGVEACNTSGNCGKRSTLKVTVSAKTIKVPGSVKSFKVTGGSKVTEGKTIIISWKTPSGFSAEDVKYNFYQAKPGKSLSKYKSLITYTLVSRTMKAVGTHKFAVEACNYAGKCGRRTTLNVTVSGKTVKVPGSVRSFKVTGGSKVIEGKTIIIRWTIPSGFSANEVKYNLYLAKPGQKLSKYKSLITETLVSRMMKVVGTHKFAVEACNYGGKCGKRSTMNVIVSAKTVKVPGSVRYFKVSQNKVTEGKSIIFSWKKPTGFSAEEVKYNFYRAIPGQKLSKYKSSISETLVSISMKGPGTHKFSVEPCNSVGKCGLRSTLNVIVSALPLPIPGKVTSFNVSKSQVTEGKTVSLSWKKPSGYSGTVKYNVYSAKPSKTLSKYKSLTSSRSLSKLMKGVGKHKFGVEACNTEGKCGIRSYLNVNVTAPPLPIPAKVSYFKVSKSKVTEGTTVKLSWKKPSGFTGQVKYNFYITKPGEALWKYKSLTSSTTLSRWMGGVGTHKFGVEACNAEGKCGSRTSLNVTVSALLPVPGKVRYFKVSKSSVTEGKTVTLRWVKPSGFSGTIKYNLYVTKPGQTIWKYKSFISYTSLSRLMKGVGLHKFSIEACNTEGKCGTRSSLNVTVNAPPLPIPGNVSSFTVSKNTVTEGETVTFNWGKPTGFSGTVKYNVYRAKPEGVLYKYLFLSNSTSSSIMMKKVGRHTFSVEACNTEAQCGPRSSLKVNVTIPDKPDTDKSLPIINITQPTQSQIINATNRVVVKLEVSASNGSITQVEVKLTTDTWQVLKMNSNNQYEFDFGQLVSGDYTLGVRATGSNKQIKEEFVNFSVSGTDENGTDEKIWKVIFIHTDLLGTPVAETDENGDIQ